MADNVTLPGSGSIVASDEVNGVQYQRVKICQGGEGLASDISINNPLYTNIVNLFEQLLLALYNPPYLDKSINAIRNQVQSGTISTVSTVTTCNTVSNISTIDTYQGRLLMIGTNINTWANTVRRTIS